MTVGVSKGATSDVPGAGVLPNMVIALEGFSSKNPPVFIGERARRSTATSVVLLDPTTLACCQFDGCRMSLVKFDLGAGTSSVVGSIDTIFGGKRCETDLMTWDGRGNLMTTNFYQQTCSLYRYEEGQIRFVRDLAYQAGDRVHGIKFADSKTAAVTSRGKAAGVHFFDLESLRRVFLVPSRGESGQDLCFTEEGRLALITTLGHPSLFAVPIYSSRIYLIEYDVASGRFAVTARREFKTSHFDNMVCYAGRLYVTDQYNERVVTLDARSLEPTGDLWGYTFPHGLDANFGIIAVTNYGNNTLSLKKLAANGGDVARKAVPLVAD